VSASKPATNLSQQSIAFRPEPRLLDIPAAAAYLSCTVWFVRTLIWEGRIPFLKLGKRLLLDRSDLDAFVGAQKEEGRR